MNLTLIAAFIRALAGVASMTSTGKRSATITAAANYGALLIEQGAGAETKLQDLTSQVNGFVSDPSTLTDESFNELKRRSDAAHAAIQSS